ncbi:hypothetical protein HMSLTHF_13340 [Vreelandella aquamarina]|uniref:Uncharacterized protein n=1 Tax=Vreelandella aquamarina TaxID=77097 RepID=A0A6F8STR9_9GAMM|nr:hypothetical protein HMSLTHF_13340 [Halomonas meridiana]
MVHLIVTYDVLKVSTVTGQDHHGAALTLWTVTITTAKVAWLYMSAVRAL